MLSFSLSEVRFEEDGGGMHGSTDFDDTIIMTMMLIIVVGRRHFSLPTGSENVYCLFCGFWRRWWKYRSFILVVVAVVVDASLLTLL